MSVTMTNLVLTMLLAAACVYTWARPRVAVAIGSPVAVAWGDRVAPWVLGVAAAVMAATTATTWLLSMLSGAAS